MDETQIGNLIKMLQSPDEENQVLALNLLDTNMISIPVLLMCYKAGHPDRHFWIKHAPESWKKIYNISEHAPYIRFSFKQILHLIKQHNDILGLKVFCNEYAKDLIKQCGIPEVENIEIKIHFKNEHTE